MLSRAINFGYKMHAAHTAHKIQGNPIQRMTTSNGGYQTINQRNYRVVAGTNKTPVAKSMPSTETEAPIEVQSDMTGYHKICVVKTCPTESQCYKRLCDTTQEDICPYKIQDPKLIAELGGALTHMVPLEKEGVLLDTVDGDGKPKPQYMIKEKTAIPVDMTTFKENEKMTEYVQQKDIAEKIGKNLPANSILNLKNTSMTNTPTDDFA